MIIKCYNQKIDYLLFIDVEFDCQKLVQFAGLLFKKIDTETYQLQSSYNTYVTEQIGYPFTTYTSITNDFLKENGIPLDDAVAHINDFIDQADRTKMMAISHGLKSDKLILVNNGINLFHTPERVNIAGYCTHIQAQKILERNKELSLQDIALEAGYYIHQSHNAYNDVWATVAVFTYLEKIKQQKKLEQ